MTHENNFYKNIKKPKKMTEVALISEDQLDAPETLEWYSHIQIVEVMNLTSPDGVLLRKLRQVFPHFRVLRNQVTLSDTTPDAIFKYITGLCLNIDNVRAIPDENQITHLHIDAITDMRIPGTFPKLERVSLNTWPLKKVRMSFHSVDAIKNLKKLVVNNPLMEFDRPFLGALEANEVMEECMIFPENIPRETLDVMKRRCPNIKIVYFLIKRK
jgi:hypothetical protein